MESRMKLTMLDDYWFDFRRDTRRRWFAPEAFRDLPLGCYASMVYDPELGRYRFYYEVPIDLEHNGSRNLFMIESADLETFSEPLLVYDGDWGVHGSSVFLDLQERDRARRYKFIGMIHAFRRPHRRLPELFALRSVRLRGIRRISDLFPSFEACGVRLIFIDFSGILYYSYKMEILWKGVRVFRTLW